MKTKTNKPVDHKVDDKGKEIKDNPNTTDGFPLGTKEQQDAGNIVIDGSQKLPQWVETANNVIAPRAELEAKETTACVYRKEIDTKVLTTNSWQK